MLYATTVTTHLGNIRQNLDGVRARVRAGRPGCLVLAAVKANAYGHGAVEVARMIERTRSADWLGVATVDEGVELRRAGVRLPILKLSPTLDADETDAALAHELTLPVASARDVEIVGSVAATRRVMAAVHVKVDTGMRRIGVEPDGAVELCRAVDAHDALEVQGLFSHLPVADTADGEEFTRGQIARFAAVAAACESARGPIPLKHLANSAGVLQHPDSWFDMVRPGIMLYGSLPDPTTDATVDLAPGLTWTTAVSFVKQVRAGEGVGYGHTWTAPADTWVATLPVGYADGFTRRLSNVGRVLLGGASYPVVGRVCMDQTMIDLGPDGGSVAVGDEAVLIGRSGDEEITVQEVADRMETIPYEVTCLIGARVSRAYDTES